MGPRPGLDYRGIVLRRTCAEVHQYLGTYGPRTLIEPAAKSLAAIGLRELGGVVEFLELDDLAVADGEDVHPVARHRAPGLADLPGVVAEHEHPVLCGEEVARREIGSLLVLGDALEELLHFGRSLPAAEQRIVLAPSVHLPLHVGGQVVDDAGDVAAAEGGIEALDESDIGAAHGFLPRCDAPSYERAAPMVAPARQLVALFANAANH